PEAAFRAACSLAAALRDRGDSAGAETALAQALDVCERAGLIAQSIEAISSRAVTLALGGRLEQAREAAEEAEHLTERLRYPVGDASMREGRGATAADEDEALAALGEAAETGAQLGRPLDAARCEMLRGRRLRDSDPAAAEKVLDEVSARFEELGVPHLATRARELVGG